MALHFLNHFQHPALEILFLQILQSCAYHLGQCHTALTVLPNTTAFEILVVRNLSIKTDNTNTCAGFV